MKKIYVLFLLLIFSSVICAQTRSTGRPTSTKKTQQKKSPRNLYKEMDELKKEVKILKAANQQIQSKFGQGSGTEIIDELYYQLSEIDSSLYYMQEASTIDKISMDSLMAVKFKSTLKELMISNSRIEGLSSNNEKLSKLIIGLGISIFVVIIGTIIFFLVLKYRFDRKNRIIIRYLKRLRTDINKHIEGGYRSHL